MVARTEIARDVPLLILAGGKAQRLAHLAADTPKYLQPIQDSVCFADVHLAWAKSQGFRSVILSLGYLGDRIQAHCGNGEKYGLAISYISDGAIPLGTGGAVRSTLILKYEMLAITYGDTLLDFDLPQFLAGFAASGLSGAMTVLHNTVPGHASNADLRGNLAVYDKLSPHAEWRYIDYGFLALRRKAIAGFPAQTPLDLAVPLNDLSKSSQLFGFPVRNRFWEIGTPEALEDFRNAYKEKKIGT